MPTICGLRRRGYTPEAIRDFCARIGVAKRENVVDVALLEHAVREDLNRRAPRVMAVLRPLKVVIENYPEGQVEELDCRQQPEDPEAGTRAVPFSRELYIERDDFREDPPKKFFRLAPGPRSAAARRLLRHVQRRREGRRRARSSSCAAPTIPATRGGDAPDGRKVKATLHWVSAAHAVDAEVRLYDRLFTNMTPGDEADGGNWRSSLNPASLEVLACQVEPALAAASRATGSSSSGSATSASIAGRRRKAGVQPDRDAEGHLGSRVAADRRMRRRQHMRRRRIALAGVVMLALVTTVTGQQAPKPDFDAATLAWDRGDYVAALTAYKALLAAPGGEKWLEPIALQTGELFQTRELTTDGANPRFSRDGRFVAYETGAGTARLTRVVEPAANMRVAADVKGHSLAFLPQGDRVVYLKLQPSEELTEAQAELEKAGQTPARFVAQQRLNWLLYKHVEIVTRSLSTGQERVCPTDGLLKSAVVPAADGRVLYVTGAREDDPSRSDIYSVASRLRPPGGGDQGAWLQGWRRRGSEGRVSCSTGRWPRTRSRGLPRQPREEPLRVADAVAAQAGREGAAAEGRAASDSQAPSRSSISRRARRRR